LACSTVHTLARIFLLSRARVDAVESHLSTKRAAQQRREDAEDRRAEKAERGPLPDTLQRVYDERNRKRQSRYQSFADRHRSISAQNRAAQQARSDEYEAIDLPDPAQAWPRPHLDCSCLEVEWQLANDVIQGMYVWLPEFAHITAGAVIAEATGGHWKGAVALRYHWIIFTIDYGARTSPSTHQVCVAPVIQNPRYGGIAI